MLVTGPRTQIQLNQVSIYRVFVPCQVQLSFWGFAWVRSGPDLKEDSRTIEFSAQEIGKCSSVWEKNEDRGGEEHPGDTAGKQHLRPFGEGVLGYTEQGRCFQEGGQHAPTLLSVLV